MSVVSISLQNNMMIALIRLISGIRASNYNAISVSDAEQLVSYLKEFAEA